MWTTWQIMMTQTHKSSISVSMVAADSRPVHTCEISSAVHSVPQGWMGGVGIRGEPPAPWRPVTPHLWACKDHQTKPLKESLIKPSFVSHSPPYFLSFLRCAFVPSFPEGLLKHRPGLKQRWSPGYGLFATVAGTKKPRPWAVFAGYCKPTQVGLWRKKGKMLNGSDAARSGGHRLYFSHSSSFWW